MTQMNHYAEIKQINYANPSHYSVHFAILFIVQLPKVDSIRATTVAPPPNAAPSFALYPN